MVQTSDPEAGVRHVWTIEGNVERIRGTPDPSFGCVRTASSANKSVTCARGTRRVSYTIVYELNEYLVRRFVYARVSDNNNKKRERERERERDTHNRDRWDSCIERVGRVIRLGNRVSRDGSSQLVFARATVWSSSDVCRRASSSLPSLIFRRETRVRERVTCESCVHRASYVVATTVTCSNLVVVGFVLANRSDCARSTVVRVPACDLLRVTGKMRRSISSNTFWGSSRRTSNDNSLTSIRWVLSFKRSCNILIVSFSLLYTRFFYEIASLILRFLELTSTWLDCFGAWKVRSGLRPFVGYLCQVGGNSYLRCWSWNVVLSRAFDLFFLLFFVCQTPSLSDGDAKGGARVCGFLDDLSLRV